MVTSTVSWLSHQLVVAYAADMPILLEDLDLRKAERLLCQQALSRGGSIIKAAELLGITRHALKRRMIKHRIDWPQAAAPSAREHLVTTPEPVAPIDR
ncbi:MAG: hypothetical protein KDK70_14725 [Myxococcales bacterium]|nr:hypothetical protein [Myxococcales bacterium]